MLLGVALTRLALRRVSGGHARARHVVVLGLGAALGLGGTSRVAYAAAPTAVAAAGALLLSLAPRAGSARRPGEGERMLRGLAASLAAACCGGVLPAPGAQVAAAGALLLGAIGLLVLIGLLAMRGGGILDTRLSAEWFIALRYLLAKRRQTFISVITGICVVGIAAGVWLIITVLSVMNGFERVWRDEIIGNRAHFTVHSTLGPIEGYSDVLASVTATPDVTAGRPSWTPRAGARRAAARSWPVRVRAAWTRSASAA